MKKRPLGFTWVAIAAVLAGCGASQEEATRGQTQELAASSAPIQGVPSGTLLEVTLDQELSLAGKPGDSFTAKVSTPVMLEGKTLIPSGTAVRGSIEAIEEPPQLSGATLLTLNFREIEIQGYLRPLRASMLDAKAPAPSASDPNADADPAMRPQGEDTAPQPSEATSEPAATGEVDASSRLVLGEVVRAPGGASAPSAAARMAIVMKTAAGTTTLPAGSVIRLRLEESLDLSLAH